MGIAAMKKPALIKVPIKLERVKRPRLFPLLIFKPWLILSVVIMRLDTLLFASSMLAQLHCGQTAAAKTWAAPGAARGCPRRGRFFKESAGAAWGSASRLPPAASPSGTGAAGRASYG
jgi:hypothetical protein